jgi:DNA processing protein
MSTKDILLEVAEKLPPDASLVDAIYELEFRQAVEQGREVFAIPGSIHNPLAKGCHALIRQGAKLVETAADILEELGALAAAAREPASRPAATPATVALDEEYRQLLVAMGDEPVGIDLLVDRCGLTAEALSSMLLILELEGYVAAIPGGLYGRLKT